MTLKFNKVCEIVNVHVRAKYHQAEYSGSWSHRANKLCALSRNGEKSTNLVP